MTSYPLPVGIVGIGMYVGIDHETGREREHGRRAMRACSSNSVTITGTGAAVPERVLTNRELEKMLDTTDQWIVQRTGIRERRIAGDGTATYHLAAAAAGRALRDARVDPKEVDLILVATSTPDQLTVPTAGLVQQALGISRTAALDLSAACAGFPYGLAIGAQFIRNGVYRTVLVVGAEIFSRIVNWRDRSTAILFGDGAGAVVLRPATRAAAWRPALWWRWWGSAPA